MIINSTEILREYMDDGGSREVYEGAQKEIKALTDVLYAGIRMRQAQKEFFKNRKRVSEAQRRLLLQKAQDLEQEYDELTLACTTVPASQIILPFA